MSKLGLTTLGLTLACLSSGCATTVRFKDQPVIWQVDDTRDIAEPEEREYFAYQYMPDALALRRSERLMEIRDEEPARNVNSLDEVPNSTWFQNRIGMRTITPEEAAAGPDVAAPPKLPLTVVSGKSGGGNPGFIAKDETGRRFVVKFDTHENPEMQTGGNMVVGRIFWTIGFNVPADHVFHFGHDDVTAGPDAKYKDDLGDKVPFTERELHAMLEGAPKLPDGTFRATASQFLDGIPKGGFSADGIRDDDPNDRVPHEHRRELRGLRVFSAWLNHTDMKEDNTLSMYVEEDGRHFLRHYLLDFGEALGGHAAEKGRNEDGWEYFLDWEAQTKAMFTFGLYTRPWEYLENTRWAALGNFSALGFDPDTWREAYPYWPFFETTAQDAFWATKIILRFDRSILEAVVAEAQFTEPGAAAYLVDTLIQRRDIIGHKYLEALSPLDHFEARPGRLCMIDLGLAHGLATLGQVERLDRNGDAFDRATPSADGFVCLSVPNDEEYRVLHLRVRRAGDVKPAVDVHLKGGPHARVLGIVRHEH